MNRKNIYLVQFLVFVALGCSGCNISSEQVKDISVLTAMKRYVCFDSYWMDNENYRFGETVQLNINSRNDNTYIWVENLESQQFMPSNAGFIQFKSADDALLPVVREFFNQNAMKDSQNFELRKSIVFSGTVVHRDFVVPAQCTPEFLPSSELKAKILVDVRKSIADELAQLDMVASEKKYGSSVEVVIANFDIDYPMTFAYLPGSGEVFRIELNSSPDANIGEYLAEGGFPVGFINNSTWETNLKPKIQANALFKGKILIAHE